MCPNPVQGIPGPCHAVHAHQPGGKSAPRRARPFTALSSILSSGYLMCYVCLYNFFALNQATASASVRRRLSAPALSYSIFDTM